MGSSIVLITMAMVAQAAAPAPKPDEQPAAAVAAKLNDARRLLRNGRYAEAEEALAAIEAEAKKEPAGLNPALKVDAGVEQGRVPGQPGRIRQGDRWAQGGRGRRAQECRSGRLDWPICI